MEDSHSNSKDKKFKCPHENCGFKTNNVNSIPNHIKHMHPSDPTQHPFSCHKCKFCLQKQLVLCLHFDQLFVYIFLGDKTFPYASSLSQHVEKVHLKLKSYVCEKCKFC